MGTPEGNTHLNLLGNSQPEIKCSSVAVSRKRMLPSEEVSHVNKKVMRPEQPIMLSKDNLLDMINNQDVSLHDVNKKCEEYENSSDQEPCFRPDVMDGDNFQQIHDKLTPSPTEKRCDEYGIHMRDGEPSPKDDCSLYNIKRYCADVGLNGQSSTDQYGGCSRESPYNSLRDRPADPCQNGIRFGTEQECRAMLATKMLPSEHERGIFINADLRPSPEGHYQPNEQFETVKTVGQGSQGIAASCVDNSTKKAFVIKKGNGKAKYNQHEAEILLSLKHDNIPKLYGFIDRGGTPEILLENCGLSLATLVMSSNLTEIKICEYNRQALLGLRYLAIYKILHLDIKPENVCVLNDVLKIVDFGSACLPQDKITFRGWTVEYMSPEACRMFLSSGKKSEKLPWKGNYSITGQTDVFAWGLTVLFMYRKVHILRYLVKESLKLHEGFDTDDNEKLRKEILMMVARQPNCVRDHMIPDSCNVHMKDLLFRMLDGRPELRITPDEALKEIQLQDNNATTTGIPLSGTVEGIVIGDEDKNLTVTNRRSENAASCMTGNIPYLQELM